MMESKGVRTVNISETASGKTSRSLRCPLCNSKQVVTSMIDNRKELAKTKLFKCRDCGNSFLLYKFDEIAESIQGMIVYSPLAKKAKGDLVLWR